MRTVLAIFLLATIQLGFSFDLAAYKQQYQTQVEVPYKNAVTVAAIDIIEYLAVSPVPTTAAGGRQVVTTLNTKAQIFSADLNVAAKSSDTLRQQLDKEVEQLVSQASGVEKQINANQQQLAQIGGQIQQTGAQLVDAQNQVNRAAKSVQDAQNALDREQRAVHKAEHCVIGGWLGHHLCHLINPGGMRRAHQDRDRAQNDLNGCQQRLAQFHALQAQLMAKQASLQQARANLEAAKAGLNAQLAQLNQARNNVNAVDTGLKAVVAHVGTLFGKSQVLMDVIKNLIDLETVIKPLTAIADQIISYTTNAADVNYLNAMKQKIGINLPLVQKKLPQYALIPPV